MELILDFHIHLIGYDSVTESNENFMRKQLGDRFDDLMHRYSNPDSFINLMDESRIDYAVVLAELAPITTGICSNQQVARFCSHSPRLIPFASINPFTCNNPAEELKKLVQEFGFKGLKLYPTYQYYYPNDALVYPLYAAAQELGIIVSLHTGSSVFSGSRLKYGDPLYLDDVAVDFPELPLLMCHCGRPFWYDKAYWLARLHQNVYLEISGIPPQKILTHFPDIERVSNKVVYGSDWPSVPTIKENIKVIKNLGISEESKQMILGKTGAKLLKFQER